MPAFFFSLFIVPKIEAAVLCKGTMITKDIRKHERINQTQIFQQSYVYDSIFLCSVLLYFVCHVCRCLVVFIVLLVLELHCSSETRYL